MPLFKSECRVISKQMQTVQDNILEYFWRNNEDDFMLRVELLGLKKTIEDALEHGKGPKNQGNKNDVII